MDIQTRKIKFIQKFLNIDDEHTLSRFEELLKIAQAEDKRDLEPFTDEELNQRIEQSEKDFESGHYKTTSELRKKMNL